MALIETTDDYQFAEEVAELKHSVASLTEELEEQREITAVLCTLITKLTNVIDEQNTIYSRKTADLSNADSTNSLSIFV